jgi:hypothetical protein
LFVDVLATTVSVTTAWSAFTVTLKRPLSCSLLNKPPRREQ